MSETPLPPCVTPMIRDFPTGSLILTFLFAIPKAGGLRCKRYVPRGIFVREVQG